MANFCVLDCETCPTVNHKDGKAHPETWVKLCVNCRKWPDSIHFGSIGILPQSLRI